MKLIIKGEEILAVGVEVAQGANNNVRVTKSNGEITGMSVTDFQIIELDVAEDLDVKNYKYDTQAGTVIEKPKTFYTKNDFIDLFTGSEWRVFTETAKTDDNINKFYSQILVVEWIELDDYRIQQAMGYCVTVGIITLERFNEIFANVDVTIEF